MPRKQEKRLPMAGSLVLACVGIILLAARWRYAAGGLDVAAPIPLEGWLWIPLACGCLAMAGMLLWMHRRRLAAPRARLSAVQLGLFPVLFAFEWALLPAYNEDYRWWHIAVLLGLLGVLVWGLLDDRRRGVSWRLVGRWRSAAKLLAFPTVLVVLASIAACLVLDSCHNLWKLPGSLLGYPLYAFAQLLVFLGFLPPRLRDLAVPRWQVALTAAVLFALVHWPNGLLMLGCFAGGILWAWVWQRKGSIVVAAVSMGCMATAYKLLPVDVTSNLRTGPIYVQRVVDERVRHREMWKAYRRTKRSRLQRKAGETSSRPATGPRSGN
ncbi:MAG: CPBP family intramembrane glutamic endopeptidase [Phycisphaerae bacterium]